MRFALSLASVLVLGSAAFAEEAAPPPAAPAPAPAVAPAAKKLPLRVVRVLEDTQQALLFDKTKSTHVLVEVGKQIDGFTVTDIDEDSVTLTAEGGQQIVLAGPDPRWRGHERKAAAKTAAKSVEAAPQDPYAAAAPMDPYGEESGDGASAAAPSPTAAPITAGEGGVRTAEAPVAAPVDGIRSAEAPGTPAKVVVTAAIPSSTIPTAAPTAAPTTAPTTVATTSTSPSPSTSTTTPTTTAPTTPEDTSSSAAWSTAPTPAVDREAAAIADLFASQPDPTPAKPKAATKAGKASKAGKTDKKIASVSAAEAPTPAVAATPATRAAPAANDGATVIAKADVTAALGNFGALASAVRGSFGADGAHLDAIAPNSLFAKAGLQAGDTVTAVNNKPLRSLDDAATLYARAGTLKSATIQVTRAGKPISLRLAIQ